MRYILSFLVITLSVFSCTPPKDVSNKGKDVSPKEEINVKKEVPNPIVENDPSLLIGKKYRVLGLESSTKKEMITEKHPTITFNKGNKANVKLSVNGCFASYSATATELKIMVDGCTEACCDNKNDQLFTSIMNKKTFHYHIKNGGLVFYDGKNKVILEETE